MPHGQGACPLPSSEATEGREGAAEVTGVDHRGRGEGRRPWGSRVCVVLPVASP